MYDKKIWHLNKIPKIFHLYWGGDKLTYLRYLTAYTLRKLHPDWTIKVHCPAVVFNGDISWSTHEHALIGLNKVGDQQYFEKLKDLDIEFVYHDFEKIGFKNDVPENFKSDFIRYYLLYTEGGVWSDFDILYYKPIEDAEFNKKMNQNKEFGISIIDDELFPTAFLLSQPNSLFYKTLIEKSLRPFDVKEYQSVGPVLFKSELLKVIDNINCFCFSPEVFQALTWRDMEDMFVNNVELPSSSIAVHWFAGDVLSQFYNQKINEINLIYQNSTISNLILNQFDIKNTKDFSIIIPMSCECEELKWCLFFLIDQKTNYNFEVIVVDDGLENNKIESICKLFSLKLQIRYFFTGQKTKHKLIRHKKNRTFEEVVDEGVKISNGNNIIVLHPQMCFLESSTLDTFVKKIELNEFSITAIESCTEDLNGSYYNQVESSHGSKTNIGYMQNRNPCDCVFGFKKTINYKETERKTINLPIVKMKKSDEVVMKSWFS
jgi:hypothetical protein